jgi:dCTP deaminase
MILSDIDIRRYIDEGKIKISPPLPPEQWGICPVDFRLGNEFSAVTSRDQRERLNVRDF